MSARAARPVRWRRPAAVLGPEVIAAALVATIIGFVAGGPSLPSLGAGTGSLPTSQPITSADDTPAVEAEPWRRTVSIALETNDAIVDILASLQVEAKADPFEVARVRSLIQRMQFHINFGLDTVEELARDKATATVAKSIASTYEALRKINRDAFDASVTNITAHKRAVADLIAGKDDLAAIGTKLKELRAKPPAQLTPSSVPGSTGTRPAAPSPSTAG